MMDGVLAGLKFWFWYLDDVIVDSPNTSNTGTIFNHWSSTSRITVC
jgi:hypothetical protein